MITAPQLFARYIPTGDNICFFCGGLCGREMRAKEFVKESFTSLDTVTLSKWVCPGCVATQSETATIELVDGEVRHDQKIRGYSWIITKNARLAATKSHRQKLIEMCIVPPRPPFVISIADSGQKHLLYRAVVNQSRSIVTASLEGIPITYEPHVLLSRIELVKRLIAAVGKPALEEPLTTALQMRVVEHYDSAEFLTAWQSVSGQQLSKLALWLAPKKEDCEREFPSVETISTETRKSRHGNHQATLGGFD